MVTTRNWLTTAKTLSEALPYMQRYDNSVVVVKIGGNAIGESLTSFAKDIVLMRQIGINAVAVHGGGPKINLTLDRLGIESSFINGKRVSSPEIVEIAEMVLSGHVNKQIVQAINMEGGQAIGISGKDANIMVCEMAEPELGLVGIPKKVNATVLRDLFKNGLIPVIAPIGVGEDGTTLNVNGDTAAGAIASALNADRLLLLTDVDGVLDNKDTLISRLIPEEVESLIQSGIIKGGMLPKTETALNAVRKGVRAVVILNGKTPNSVLLELFTPHGIGTLISRSPQ
ncbi:MAG: acetylglutamate kinase [Rhodobacteraceae bacterium]|nr:acetylglutamate kinase [Paracoccaceae bacterium]MCY4249137.1 acetylglutamate kinase [Paracoccaceae bacterium]